MAECLWIGAVPAEGEDLVLTPVKAPTKLKQSIQDLDSSSTTRTASGKMVRSVVRGGAEAVRKLELEWELIGEQDMHTILNLLAADFVTVKYRDVLTASYRTAVFYCGDRTIEAHRIGTDGQMVGEMSFNLIEQ
jgi:hypothetical protein